MIKHDANTIVADLIRSIVVEGMLHLTMAANVLNAMGGTPTINKPTLFRIIPLATDERHEEDLVVGLAPLSKPLIKDVFMEIEMPEDPKNFPVKSLALQAAGFATIGVFYAAIKDKLKELGDKIFTGKPALQVVNNSGFRPTSSLRSTMSTARRGA